MSIRTSAAVSVISVLLAACAANPPSAPSGAETFATHCAACHGASGRGDGPVAAALRIPVPNLRTLAQRNGGTFPADRVASRIDGRNLPAAHGASAMPIWGSVFETTARLVADAEQAETRIDELVAYLRQIQDP